MGFKKQATPTRLIFSSFIDENIDNDVLIAKWGTIAKWADAARKDPTNREFFPAKAGTKCAEFHMRVPTVEDLAQVRDGATALCGGGKNWRTRYEAAHNMHLFRVCLVRAVNVFPGETPCDFGGEAPVEGEAPRGTVEELCAILPPDVQSNIGMLLQCALNLAGETQGK